jgi:hypothetical protein
LILTSVINHLLRYWFPSLFHWHYWTTCVNSCVWNNHYTFILYRIIDPSMRITMQSARICIVIFDKSCCAFTIAFLPLTS